MKRLFCWPGTGRRIEHPLKSRPYWHVDAKWITGLLLAFVLSLALVVYTLAQITAEGPAVDTLTVTMALMFSPQGLDSETEIIQFRQQLEANPGESIQPIPGLQIAVRAEDIANLSPREARLFFFRQLAEPLYRQGTEGLMALADAPEMQASLGQGVGPFSLFTLETHQLLRRTLLILAVICLALLLLLIFFSYRFGRLGSPGCAIFAASLPGALLFTFIASAIQPMDTPPQNEGMSGMIGYLAANVLPPLVKIASRTHLVSLTCGFGLLALAVFGGFLIRLVRGQKSG